MIFQGALALNDSDGDSVSAPHFASARTAIAAPHTLLLEPVCRLPWLSLQDLAASLACGRLLPVGRSHVAFASVRIRNLRQ